MTSSLGNVVVVLFAAALLPPNGVGALAVVLAAYQIALAIVRGVVSDPLLLSTDPRTVNAPSSAAVIGVLSGPVAGSVVWILGVDATLSLVVGVAMPLLVFQDGLRYVAFRRRRPRWAAISDCAWFGLTTGALVGLLVVDSRSVTTFALWWVAGGLLGLVILVAALRPSLAPGLGVRNLFHERRLRVATTLDSLLASGVQQLALLEVAALSSLEATGTVRFLMACFGPVTLVFTTMYVDGLWSVHEAHGPAGRLPAGLVQRRAAQMSAALGVSAGLVAVALAITPGELGRGLSGPTFDAARDVLLLFALSQIVGGLAAGAYSGLRFSGRTGDATRIRGLWAVVLVVGSAIGAETHGASGFATALLLANTVVFIGWWGRLVSLPDPPASR